MRFKYFLTVLVSITLSVLSATVVARNNIVADNVTHSPLPNASVFDRNGRFIGVSASNGRLPYASDNEYPLTLRYIGFKEQSVHSVSSSDTIFMTESIMELPEVLIESRNHKVMHILAYVREYSTLTTYTDTVFMFREKMVDFMLNPDPKVRFKGWNIPRVLASKSYYRFTNAQGLDSVSDRCNHHFSWTDWVGIVPSSPIPEALRKSVLGTDTVFGKYSPTETWLRTDDHIDLDINVLTDTTSRKWVPNLTRFFHKDLDFEQFRLRLKFDNIVGGDVSPVDLTGYSFNIESNGRGHAMFRFNRRDEPFFVSTYAETYILDKEYITVKEARKWDKHDFNNDKIDIIEPSEAPELQPGVKDLVDRVLNVDHDKVRLAIAIDKRLAGRPVVRLNAGQQILQRLKNLFGISSVIANRRWKKKWNNFSHDQMRSNNSRADF